MRGKVLAPDTQLITGKQQLLAERSSFRGKSSLQEAPSVLSLQQSYTVTNLKPGTPCSAHLQPKHILQILSAHNTLPNLLLVVFFFRSNI